MKASVKISATEVTSHEGAVINLCADDVTISELYFDFSKLLKSVRSPTDTALDFLVVATTVYSLDKLTPRSEAENGWERSFDVTIPVKDSTRWSKASKTINECVSFLSGDKWRLTFTERTQQILRGKRRQRRSRIQPRFARANMTCLFSGGLDSLIGAINLLEESKGGRIALVGHHDPNIGGVEKDQKQLVTALQSQYPNQCEPILVGVGNCEKSPEITMRSRSLLFIALGITVAEHLGSGTTLLIPENGTIALNVPLTPARRGSCSTRTAHPYYLSLLQRWLIAVGLDHPIENPLIGMTKGEAVSLCANQDLLANTASLSTSCAKPGHTMWWVRRNADGCGQCMPCIYRRAALHAAGLDNEIYGNDICTGEVDVADPNSDAADDFRACLAFLRKKYSQEQIAKMLISAGPLPPLEVLGYADTVHRAMEEIRQLLRDKANVTLQKMAGI
ncbi:Qat anti-phage system QueC-like protein QatC [Stieleria varia]|uniref:7-cyano-7-deazaguanine synthase n=1 Tax=Stieleria varia TaxID=2528005 RepID=A0A5C6B9S3_9BACT|nr:Qat anti-phage system QueC-like protein QatC [Stieleria varia]TWU08382.1 7-cyano-7-deazaguanine synthase [Stieleria varia]